MEISNGNFSSDVLIVINKKGHSVNLDCNTGLEILQKI